MLTCTKTLVPIYLINYWAEIMSIRSKERQRSTRSSPADFVRDESGAALIYVTLMMLALAVLLGLAVDGARYMYLNSNLQEIADAAALAGAAELDGRSDAITRATDAAVNYLSNNANRWSDVVNSGTQIVNSGADAPVFLSSRNPDVTTTDPKSASYIRVTTTTRSITLSFARLMTTVTQADTTAKATARSSFSACAEIQSFLCNPFESTETVKGGAQNWAANVSVGQMFVLAGGSGGSPGNWGLIDPPGQNGHNPHDQAAFWSEQIPDSCPQYTPGQATNYPDPGNNASAAAPGMNVRFDNPVKNLTNIAAPIVIDGLKTSGGLGGYSCANDTSTTTGTAPNGNTFVQTDASSTAYLTYQSYCNKVSPNPLGSCPLPRDRNMTPVSSANPALTSRGRGVDITDLQAYWTNHHNGTLPTGLDTRWKVYQCEVDSTKCPAGTDASFTNNTEASAPRCNNSTVGDATRRLINVAMVDCNYWGITGASSPLPITTLVAQFFMTEPAVTNSTPSLNGRIYGELVRTYTVNSQGSGLYHIVQLVK